MGLIEPLKSDLKKAKETIDVLATLAEDLLDEAEEWGKEYPRTGGVAAKLQAFETVSTFLYNRYHSYLSDEQNKQLQKRYARRREIEERYG